jgi:hypothetical protein
MVLLLVVAVKLPKNLYHVGVGVRSAKCIARTVKTKDEFNIFIGLSSLLDGRTGSVRHIE